MKDFNAELKEINEVFTNAIKLAMSNDEVMSRHKDELETKFSDNGFKIFSSVAVYFGNYGRRPGKMPPKGILEDWLKRHNIEVGAEFPVRRKIGKEGTPGRQFMPDFKKEVEWMQKKITDKITFELGYDIAKKQNELNKK